MSSRPILHHCLNHSAVCLTSLLSSGGRCAFTSKEGLLHACLLVQVAESLTGLKSQLNIIATDTPIIEGLWALVPCSRRFTIIDSSDSPTKESDDTGIWNHFDIPTIFVNTVLDSLLARMDISHEEGLHILLKEFAVAIHELGHFLHLHVNFQLYCSIIHYISHCCKAILSSNKGHS
jgi:hypothetical protein